MEIDCFHPLKSSFKSSEVLAQILHNLIYFIFILKRTLKFKFSNALVLNFLNKRGGNVYACCDCIWEIELEKFPVKQKVPSFAK